MNIVIEEGDKTIVLHSSDEDEDIELEEVTTVNYSNLYGEAVTISALLNKVGMWKAEYERRAKEAKLYCDIFVSQLRKQYRREALQCHGTVCIDGESVKLTEKSLDEIILLNEEYQKAALEQIELESKRDKIESLFWAVKSKDQKLNNLLPKVVPKEFFQELVEGKINSFIIYKPKQ